MYGGAVTSSKAAVLAVTCGLILAAQGAFAQISQQDITDILAAHNKARALYGPVPALTWSTRVQGLSQAAAEKLAVQCQIYHMEDELHAQFLGENLGIGFNNWTQLINAFVNEVWMYDFDKPGFSSGTGHFTQVVWKSTWEVGCG
eukprot:CAMPEP_0206144092 /NCGR_PEP_ID=MMETSP1473-20131121/22946_1 /ASSEMBLY_ACC=CAM_ASM_001109 /TAXON_ID=1461547 /ORGANISM="Stichococcus sp, Strain RCC1054" /LENGTH=144 /DNA_ID=CAMNT_0053539787 /DNA_START=209 /DNA_END=640 /DNA_ORIENTATION=+